MKGQVRRVVAAVVWVVVVAVLSFGAAGLIGAMSHQPGTSARPELTYPGDQAIEPGLTAAEAELEPLADEVRELSDLGRAALGALVSGNSDVLESTVADGRRLATAIQDHARRLHAMLDALPGVGPGAELVVSAGAIGRHARAVAAAEAAVGLAGDWSGLAAGALSAIRVDGFLLDHDRIVGEAAADGRVGNYKDALAKLTIGEDLIAQARSLRDELATKVDVGTLTTWLDLNADYDATLRDLYQAIVDSKGKVNAKVRAAFAAEKAARARLPGDTKAIVIILAEIGRGGLNQAVIAIEEARGEVEAAVEGLTAEPSDGAPSSPPAP